MPYNHSLFTLAHTAFHHLTPSSTTTPRTAGQCTALPTTSTAGMHTASPLKYYNSQHAGTNSHCSLAFARISAKSGPKIRVLNLLANTPPSTSTKMASTSGRTRSTTSQTNAVIQAIFAEPAIPIQKLTTPQNIAQLSAELIPPHVSPELQATMRNQLIQGLQYIDLIKAKYPNQPVVVDRFRDMFREFREAFKVNPFSASLNLLSQLVNYWKNDPDLIIAFSPFLSEGWQLQLNETMDEVKITIPDYQPLYIILPSSLAPVSEPVQDALDLSIPKGEDSASQLPPKKVLCPALGYFISLY